MVIVDSQIGDRRAVTMSVIEGAVLTAGAEIGPFAHLRGGS